ncbi:hypothetical protein [Paenibacillus alvei]|uniref:hypothetical protein n=1 Tax=Paenibacillus alvei TaxID=44250 RepID=UPI002281F400|nr:hypothetical protein [Paenibacillus alvei]
MDKIPAWKQLDEIGRKVFEQLKREAKEGGVPFHYREEDDEFITRIYPDGRKMKVIVDELGQEKEELLDD